MKKTLLTCALFFMALLATAQPTWEQLGGVYYAYPERSAPISVCPRGFSRSTSAITAVMGRAG